MQTIEAYKPKNKIRIVTSASLFDGHDAAINIMRRIIQSTGVEVIHLGHNRSVDEIVNCAIQEDVQAIAITSYQGGHTEYFKYMYDLLKERNASHIKIFGGGGGTILADEIADLHNYGIARIYSPDDGRKMGLQGMINDLVQQSDFPIGERVNGEYKLIPSRDPKAIGRMISAIESDPLAADLLLNKIRSASDKADCPVLGIAGTGGAGKSSIVDEFVRRFLLNFEDKSIAIISVDPTRRRTGGALLGDRIRMNSINHPRVYMRSLATRRSNLSLSESVPPSIEILKHAGFDLIILESSGIGQSDTEIVDFVDLSMYVMTPEYGAASQLEKIDMLDFANIVALNKFDKRGALDALRDVKKQMQRNKGAWHSDPDQMPVYGTIASQFNDPGMNRLFAGIINQLADLDSGSFKKITEEQEDQSQKIHIIPPNRNRYLSEIAETIRNYNGWVEDQADLAAKIHNLEQVIDGTEIDGSAKKQLEEQKISLEEQLAAECRKQLESWNDKRQAYEADEYVFKVRQRELRIETSSRSLSNSKVPKIALPKYRSKGDTLKWILQENVPGDFPFTAGVYPFKREGEDPTRMFAGEGGPERTNKRFHYLSANMPAKRLSTAFDSVTLYGEDPDYRPDIYGKIGNAGVSICCLDDAKKLYSGFNLCDPKTSVSMTINGPAPMLTAFFMNAAIDQQCELYIKENGLETEVNEKMAAIFKAQNAEQPQYLGKIPDGNDGLGLMLLGVTGDQVLPEQVYEEIKARTLSSVRGTVQADILKEDQAQNTCIFSTEFALKLMGDVQQYFVDQNVRNFYSVSISGYHIAEAGANPITQLALTLSNGFTYLEYYIARGMSVDEFAPNFSFFFSNGVDPEYAVIGRVARRIWAKALKLKYDANKRSQMLKYHIQTSGRSLHAQEVEFNDIRTTLQALYAIYDNCNSLHTNAYDEAITTPTEESVRRAVAIQMIINHELGLAKNENPLQGAFIIEYLTDLVEEAVLQEFDRITERGGVLGAMETMYQRSKIQEESLYYESKKHSGELPIMGVNTFLSANGSPTIEPKEVIRSETQEKENQIHSVQSLWRRGESEQKNALKHLKEVVLTNGNIFDELMNTAKCCSLGQISHALYEVGGQYRRNM